MSRLHVICKNGLHLKKVGPDTYESGYWPVAENDALRLIGGMLFLHEAKAARSYFGGIVENFRQAGTEWQQPERLVFTFRAARDGRGQRWHGRDDPMAWVSGVIDD